MKNLSTSFSRLIQLLFSFHEIHCCLSLSLFSSLLFSFFAFRFVFIFGLSTRTISLYFRIVFLRPFTASSIPFGYSVSNCEYEYRREKKENIKKKNTQRTESFHRHFNSFNFLRVSSTFYLLTTLEMCMCMQTMARNINTQQRYEYYKILFEKVSSMDGYCAWTWTAWNENGANAELPISSEMNSARMGKDEQWMCTIIAKVEEKKTTTRNTNIECVRIGGDWTGNRWAWAQFFIVWEESVFGFCIGKQPVDSVPVYGWMNECSCPFFIIIVIVVVVCLSLWQFVGLLQFSMRIIWMIRLSS